MPANVDSMFSVRQMPWHREGTILSDYPGSWADARTLAGLDWDPITTEVYACTGIDPSTLTEVYEQVEGWKAISRSDTGAVLSINRDTYTVINHGEMGEIVEAVLAQPKVIALASSAAPAIATSRRTSSVRNRKMAPAAL